MNDLEAVLPNVFFQSGNFAYKLDENLIYSTAAADGTQYSRLRLTDVNAMITSGFSLSREELVTFFEFFNQTLSYGRNKFYFTNPITNKKTGMYFVQPKPTVSHETANNFSLAFTIQVINSDTIS